MNIAVENGSFSYNSGKKVFSDINFEVGSGDLLAILGPNGSGKTTLLRCMMGFLKWNEGKSLLDSEDIKNYSYRKLWQNISYVPQAKGIVTSYTIEELILLGLSSKIGVFSKPSEKDRDKANKILKKLDIESLKERKCNEISGGELQMALIGKALISEPKVLILDEPESNLDFRNQLLILEVISELSASGMTCIFNTHYPVHALQRANKSVLICKEGEYFFGNTKEIITEENIKKAFGVKAVIGNIETPENIVQSVVPLEILTENDDNKYEKSEKREVRLAVISIITNEKRMNDKINKILFKYEENFTGRMEMPYGQGGTVTNVIAEGMQNKIEELVAELNVLPYVSVKATYAHR